ncbi:MAG TPA: UbiA-like polyprenyltransferase [Gemmatimonadaceae bacterium]|nr:UbiA-like polyprenyltransferase [Gemmatimonadaceae bacterium]
MSAPSVREGQTFGGSSRVIAYANLVKLPHTVFALPFALVGVVLGSFRRPLQLTQVGWVILAFTAARFAAMGFNRIVDRDIDRRNPRTAMRELPRGTLRVGEAWTAVLIAASVFVFSAAQLNWLCLALSPIALAWIFFYSYTKRFTRWSHLVLGWSLAIAPVGGYLAVVGGWSRPGWMLLALAAAVAAWVGGFDIFYSLQDVEFDRAQQLQSVPAAMGAQSAIVVARVMHLLSVAFLALVGIAVHGGAFYWAGVVLSAALLAYEHSLVREDDLTKLDAAFFTMNGMISILFFFLVLLDRLARAGFLRG